MKRKAQKIIKNKPNKKIIMQLEPANNPKFKQLVQKQKKNLSIKSYTHFRFRKQLYKIGDILMLQNGADTEDLHIAQLLNIFQFPSNNQKLPLLQIKWYYSKKDLPPKYSNKLQFMSDSQIFPTQHIDYIYIDFVFGKAQIYSQEQYQVLSNVSRFILFKRANYNIQTQQLVPPTEQWRNSCICQKPSNPDLLYIQCDRCSEWFHAKCFDIEIGELVELNLFECGRC